MAKVDLTKQRPNRITEWRIKRDISSQKLADMVGATQGAVHHLETGRRRLTQDWLTRFADALGVHPSDLLPAYKGRAPEKGAVVQPETKPAMASEHFQPIDARVASLEKLGELRAKKLITPEQFRAERKRLLKS